MNKTEEIVSMLKNGIKAKEVSGHYGCSISNIYKHIGKAEKLGLIEDRHEFILNKHKLKNNIVKRIVEDRKKGMLRGKIMEKYAIGESTFGEAMRKAKKLGYLSEEEHQDITLKFMSLSFKRKKEIYGDKKAREMCSEAWSKGMGNNHEMLISAATAGGEKTQETSPHVQKNLKNAEAYGHYPTLKYNGIEFQSRGELWTGLMLMAKGYFKRISYGKNYQVPFKTEKTSRMDYLITLNGKETAVEWHPVAKDMNEENYYEKRLQNLQNSAGISNLIVLEKYKDFYLKGLSTFSEYMPMNKKANKKLDKIVELSEVPF